MRTLVNDKVNNIWVISKNQNARFQNVHLKIDYNDRKKIYNFDITGKEISIQIEKIEIVKSELKIEQNRHITYMKGYFNNKAFEMYIS